MFASLLSHLCRYILSIRPFLWSGVRRFEIHGGETPVEAQDIIGSKCIEYKKNSGLFSGKLTDSKIVRTGKVSMKFQGKSKAAFHNSRE